MAIILDQIKGLADSKWNGIPGSVYKCVGLDIHSTPGITKVQQKLTKNSGSTVDAFCRVAVNASNGYTFWFSYTTGKIFARNSSGTWSLAYTTSPAAGSAGCLGAIEFNGYIFWATQSRLFRIAIANADDSWASVDTNWQTFSITDSEFHPMAIQDATLFIGDGYYVSKVTAAMAFTAAALDIKTPHRVKCMSDYELDLVVGTIVATTVGKAEIFRWDTVSSSWISSDTIEANGINCFIRDDNDLYVQAGRAGMIYFYNGEKLEPAKRIPGDYSNVKYGEVYPGSTATFKGIPVFGFSNSPESGNSTGNPADQGVYSFGAYSRDYQKVLDLSFVISEAVVVGIEIGAILVSDFDIFVAWKNGSSFGVDKIDYTAKYASAYFETRMMWQNERASLKLLQQVEAFYASLPASTSFTFSYSVNGAAYVAMPTAVTDTKRFLQYSELGVDEIGSLQIKVAFNVSSNSAPEMEALGITKDGNEEDA